MLTKAYATDFFGAIQSLYDTCHSLPLPIIDLELRRISHVFSSLPTEEPRVTQIAHRQLNSIRSRVVFHESDRNEWLHNALKIILDKKMQTLEELARN